MNTTIQNYRPRQNRHVGDRQHYQKSLMSRPKDGLLKLAKEAGFSVQAHTPKPLIVKMLVEAGYGEGH